MNMRKISPSPIGSINSGPFFYILLFFLILTDTCGWAQKKEGGQTFLQRLDSISKMRIDLGKSVFTPFIAPSYSPETKIMLTAGGLLTFKIQKDNPLVERSSIPFSIGFSSSGAILANIKFNIFGKNDKYRSIGEFWYKDMPDHYWGVGYDQGIDTPKSDTTTQYMRKYFLFYQKFLLQIAPKLYLGTIIDLNHTEATSISQKMENDPYIQQFGPSMSNTGLGVVLEYDTRDMAVNAYKGVLLSLGATFYGRYLMGENVYQALELDYRHYKTIVRERQVLAWEVKTRTTFGDVPWPELSQIGTPFDLRGYEWGRFRDKTIVLGLLEYRHMFLKKKMTPHKDSQFGFASWVGMGTLGKNYANLSDWLPNLGVGLRVEIQPRMNLRIDYGWGRDTKGFYLSFNEAF